MNILIPMAGTGNRFKKKGITLPKPLIQIGGKTMIEWAVESLNLDGNFTFITRKYKESAYNEQLTRVLKTISRNCKIISIDYLTNGPASTCLLAKELINNDTPLLTANCDQIMKWDSNDLFSFINNSDLDAIVVTYNSQTPKNSYIKLDKNGLGVLLAEKEVISRNSLNGIHWWAKGSDFISSAETMISKNIKVNGEFYISMSFNELIGSGKKVGCFHIDETKHRAVGTPEDLEKYINENL